MRQFLVPEIVLGFIFGMIAGLFVAEFTGTLRPLLSTMDKHEGFFVASFTGLLVVATALLWRSTNALWRTTEDAFNRQVQDTQILERAYLTVRMAGIDISTSDQVMGRVIIFNAGHLPARRVSTYVRIMWSPERDESEFGGAQNPPQTFVLPVNTELPIGSGALESGKRRLLDRVGYIFVWGKVTYEDGFGNPRWLIFCHRYHCAEPKNPRGGIDPEYGRFHHHNNDGD